MARLGAEAEARALGHSPARVAIAGSDAFMAVKREELEALRALRATGSSPDGIAEFHQVALNTLNENRSRRNEYPNVYARNWLGQPEAVFSMNDDYNEGLAVLNQLTINARIPGQYYINPKYLIADPYLRFHNENIHQLVPDDVTDGQWENIRATLYATLPADSATAKAQAQFTKTWFTINSAAAMVQREIRKRIKRLFDEVTTRADRGLPPDLDVWRSIGLTPVGELAQDLCAQSEDLTHPRCPVGVQNGLTEVEQRVFGGLADPVHMGELISMVLADYRMEFIKRHGDLISVSSNPEFPTMSVQLLSMRMLYAMGLRGQFTPVLYAGIARTSEAPLSPAEVMRRFLTGGTAQMTGRPETVDFEAYSIDKMVELLTEAAIRGSSAVSRLPAARRAGPKVTTEFIDDECVFKVRNAEGEVERYEPQDPVLGPALIYSITMDGPAPTETYFENDSTYGFRPARAFWVYLLEKYGYIVKAR